jgi:hypothetical protein
MKNWIGRRTRLRRIDDLNHDPGILRLHQVLVGRAACTGDSRLVAAGTASPISVKTAIVSVQSTGPGS